MMLLDKAAVHEEPKGLICAANVQLERILMTARWHAVFSIFDLSTAMLTASGCQRFLLLLDLGHKSRAEHASWQSEHANTDDSNGPSEKFASRMSQVRWIQDR